MAKRIVQALVGILILLAILTVYFVQDNNTRMIMLCVKTAISVFVIFVFASLLFLAVEEKGAIWKIIAMVGGFSLAVIFLAAGNHLVAYVNRMERAAGISVPGDTFGGWALLAVCAISGFAALLYGLAKTDERRNGRRRPI